MPNNTYSPQSKPVLKTNYKSFGPASMEDELKLKVYTDGEVEVENIKERRADGLTYELDNKNNYVYFQNTLDANTKVQYIPKNVDKIYSTTVSRSFSIKGALAVYKNDVRKFIIKNLTRYKTEKKSLKKEIDKILKKKNQYIWTEARLNSLWNQVYIDSVTLGPYNCDTTLTASKDIEFMNDLLVIRTGNYRDIQERKTQKINTVSNTSKIVWVSPHEILNYSGETNYISSGLVHKSNVVQSGFYSGTSFNTVSYGIGNNMESYALSSKYVKVLKDEQFKTDLQYTQVPIDPEGVNLSYKGVPIEQQYFNSIYSEFDHAGKVMTGAWDGVVPSGAFIQIQTWSTNPRYIGFDGEITVKPVDTALAADIDLSHTITCTAADEDYQTSVRKAVQKAKNKFYKKLNAHLVSKGLKNKNSNTVRYETLLERVAQNVYDGLSYIRNESIAKIQGLESNPLEGPVYYDGTSKMYGGSQDEAEYDYSRTKTQRTYTAVFPEGTRQNNTTASKNQETIGGGY